MLLLIGGATNNVEGKADGFSTGAVVAAGTLAGAVPCTKPVELEIVTNTTSGNVTAVETTMTALLDGMVVPALIPVDSVTAYVIVVNS